VKFRFLEYCFADSDSKQDIFKMNRQKKRKTGTNKQKERCDRTKHFSKGFENDDSDQGKLMIFTQWSNKLVDTFI